MNILTILRNLHIHKWETTIGKCSNITSEHLGIQDIPITRICTVCNKHQQLDIHCLGLNPPKYVSTWRDK